MRRDKKLEQQRRKQKKRNSGRRQYQNRKRTCGGCRECCFVYALGSKPRLEWCKHITLTGCGCHDDPSRPEVCKAYECLWLHSNLPITYRPDRCGLTGSLRDPYRGYPVNRPVPVSVWPYRQ